MKYLVGRYLKKFSWFYRICGIFLGSTLVYFTCIFYCCRYSIGNFFFWFPIRSMFKTANTYICSITITGWMFCYNFRHGETPSMDQTQAFIQMCARFINQKPLEVIGKTHNLMSDPLNFDPPMNQNFILVIHVTILKKQLCLHLLYITYVRKLYIYSVFKTCT